LEAGKTITRGAVYRCPVCGAELSVVITGSRKLGPRCCNTLMVLTERINAVYVCPVCGSELMLVSGDTKGLQLVCCNRPMASACSVSL
jgi:competence CoiA-like predicted nuclease